MKEMLDKLSSYNIFNYLLPGILFAVLATEISSYNLLVDDIAIGVVLYYFYGLVISRVGSLVLEPALRVVRIVRFSVYSDYVTASRSDPKIDVLSEQNNSYRSLASLFFCLLLLVGIEWLTTFLDFGKRAVLTSTVVGLLALFVAAYRKQTIYIASRIDSVLRSGTGDIEK